MVIVIVGAAAGGRMAIGRALASELGWPVVDAHTDRESWAASVHAIVARALGRREHLVIACATLRPDDRKTLKGDLSTVRFVYLDGTVSPGDPLDEPDGALTLDPAMPPGEAFATIRREFGL